MNRSRHFLWITLLTLCVLLAGCSGGGPAASLAPDDEQAASAQPKEPEGWPSQLTMEDIQAMNGGQARYSADEQGHITFLSGKFYEGTIQDGKDVERALAGVSSLIGADEETVYKKGAAIVDDNGYTYYTVQQWHGESEVLGAIVKIIVAPNGETAALSSSVHPGIDSGAELTVTPEEAVEAVRAHLAQKEPDVLYTLYSQRVDKAVIPYSDNLEDKIDHLYNTYVVYTDNPYASAEKTDFPYIAHYVSANGTYLYGRPVFHMGSEAVQAGGDAQGFFQNKTALTYTGKVTLHDGSTREITVPVLLDEKEGLYYLADAQRKIAVADYWEFVHNGGNLDFSTSAENAGWDDKYLLAYANYIQTYDFYHEMGWDSADGQGTPILLLSDICDAEHNLVDNACYVGKTYGWVSFGFSSMNNLSECLDAITHEYTHGVTAAMMTTILYENETGALNEAMSDILGNIAEMMLGATDDTTWLLAEQSGQPIRCMSNPNAFGQPSYIGDLYYGPEPTKPEESNDYGGVHVNNSILAGIPPILDGAGMTLEDQRRLWLTAICALTPESGYQDFYEIFSHAAEITGLAEYQDLIDRTFEDLGIIGEDGGASAALRDGCGRFSFKADPSPGQYEASYILMFAGNDPSTRLGVTWVDKNQLVSSQLFAGDYYIRLAARHKETGEQSRFYYSGEGWSQEADEETMVSIPVGEEVVLADFAA